MEIGTDSGPPSKVAVWSDLPRSTVTVATPVTYRSKPQEDWIEFQRLVAEWGIQRGASSSLTTIVLCEAYQSIIGMGKTAVPLILRQIQSEGDAPDLWFWALRVITRADPVPHEDRGHFVRMARAWVEWGEAEGYVD